MPGRACKPPGHLSGIELPALATRRREAVRSGSQTGRRPGNPLTGPARTIGLKYRVFLSALALWGRSSTGRAPALQAGGWRFEPARLQFRI